MHPLSLLLINGYFFFIGGVLLLLGCAVPRPQKPAPEETGKRERSRRSVAGRMLMLLGFSFQAISGAAVPILYLWISGCLLAAFLAAEQSRRRIQIGVGVTLRAALCMVAVVAMVSLIPHYRVPRIDWPADQTLYVIGDSISAGLEEGDVTWPTILERHSSRRVVNLAGAGATVETALNQLENLPSDAKLVLLEIGGNDLLAMTSSRRFEKGLAILLDRLDSPGRRLIMFELPVMPSRGGYSRTQHRLARKHGVVLLPKPVLGNAFSGKDSVTDGLHLSPVGHEKLAARMARIFVAEPGTQ